MKLIMAVAIGLLHGFLLFNYNGDILAALLVGQLYFALMMQYFRNKALKEYSDSLYEYIGTVQEYSTKYRAEFLQAYYGNQFKDEPQRPDQKD